MVNDKDKKGLKGFGNGDLALRRSHEGGKLLHIRIPLHGKIKGSFETTEGNTMRQVKAKWRKFTRECTKWHFLTKKQFTGLCPPTARDQDAEDQTLGVGPQAELWVWITWKYSWGGWYNTIKAGQGKPWVHQRNKHHSCRKVLKLHWPTEQRSPP